MKRVFIIFLAVSICFGVASCHSLIEYRNEEEKDPINTDIYSSDEVLDKGVVKGGRLKLFSTVPDTLNPLLTDNFYVQQICRLIFESLIILDKAQQPVPVLCKNWEISSDGLEWTFNLRDDVKWHDDIPFTAEDVVFTLDIILKSDLSPYFKSSLQNIETFALIDKYKFSIFLKKPNSFTVEQMTFPIIPKHYYVGSNILDEAKNMAPVGTGPYRFVQFNEDKIMLSANTDWWNKEGNGAQPFEAPYIEEIEVRVYENVGDIEAAFMSKEVDLIYIEGIEYDRYMGRYDLTLKDFPGRNFEFIAFNTKNPILGDDAVRQAIALSIDRMKIIDEILPGKAVPSDIPVMPDSWIYDNNTASYMTDKDRAKDILSQSGWKEEKGMLYKRIEGRKRPLLLEITVNEENEIRNQIAQILAKQLEETGIKIEIITVKWDEQLKRVQSGDYEIAIMGCRVSPIPDISFLYSEAYLPSSPLPSPEAVYNIAGYDNYNVNTYIEGIFRENDFESRRIMFGNMKNLILDDVPYIGLFFYKNAMAYSKRIKGEINPYIWNLLNDITRWYIIEQ
ncbi:MAG TPA: peptide ABC transporter substrate-binding protein [Clostridiaceae bacterium]|nr:peptide ABC transporter substrate-binding protein [Clostridiaceae bacterium]